MLEPHNICIQVNAVLTITGTEHSITSILKSSKTVDGCGPRKNVVDGSPNRRHAVLELVLYLVVERLSLDEQLRTSHSTPMIQAETEQRRVGMVSQRQETIQVEVKAIETQDVSRQPVEKTSAVLVQHSMPWEPVTLHSLLLAQDVVGLPSSSCVRKISHSG